MAIYSYDYNFDHIPSAPFAEIEVSTLRSSQSLYLNAFIDSGADGSMLPKHLLNQLKAPRVDTRVLRTVTGIRTQVSLYRVAIRLGPYRMENVRVVGIDSTSEVILGRDVLNRLIVTLNGLASVTEISQ